MTFNQVATEWHNIHSLGLSTSTRQGYLYNLSHVTPYIGESEINEVKYSDLQKNLKLIAADGRSQRTVTGVRGTMIMVFNHAIREDYCDKNPAMLTTLPHFTKDLRDRCISTEEAALIQTFTHKYMLFPLTLLFTGIRRGEALALTWNDIDFKNALISIDKSVEFISNKAIVKKPKTSNSYRTVPIPEPLAKLLFQKHSACGEDLLFTQITTGDMHTQTSYKKMWQCWYKDFSKFYQLKTNALPQHFTAHMLRHYYITFLFENDIPDLIIQKIAGHAEIAFTRKRYTHIRKHFQEQCYSNIRNLYV